MQWLNHSADKMVCYCLEVPTNKLIHQESIKGK